MTAAAGWSKSLVISQKCWPLFGGLTILRHELGKPDHGESCSSQMCSHPFIRIWRFHQAHHVLVRLKARGVAFSTGICRLATKMKMGISLWRPAISVRGECQVVARVEPRFGKQTATAGATDLWWAEVVATSPCRVKAGCPVCCGFDSQIQLPQIPQRTRKWKRLCGLCVSFAACLKLVLVAGLARRTGDAFQRRYLCVGLHEPNE